MTITTKYDIGQKVYVYTKNGLILTAIERISVYMTASAQVNIYYWINESADPYSEDQIMSSPKAAKQSLKAAQNQIQLVLE